MKEREMKIKTPTYDELATDWLNLTLKMREFIENVLRCHGGRIEFSEDMTKNAKFYMSDAVDAIFFNERTSGSICVKYGGTETAWVCYNTDRQLALCRIINQGL